jgi:hypothetical protein
MGVKCYTIRIRAVGRAEGGFELSCRSAHPLCGNVCCGNLLLEQPKFRSQLDLSQVVLCRGRPERFDLRLGLLSRNRQQGVKQHDGSFIMGTRMHPRQGNSHAFGKEPSPAHAM